MSLMKVMMGLLFTSAAFSQSLSLPHYQNWELTDILKKGKTAQMVFNSLDQDLVKVSQSICSNRALMWVYDLKQSYNIDASKIFMFYTKKTGEVGRKTWWYHVSPMVNEGGQFMVVDAGFPGYIDTPLTVSAWLKKFTGSTKCYEMTPNDEDLIELMYKGRTFPETTHRGTYDCYYINTPAGYWTPGHIAANLLGKDASGKPVRLQRDEIDRQEVYDACLEATTSSVGRLFNNGKKKCMRFLQ
jgi:hypothetical protein